MNPQLSIIFQNKFINAPMLSVLLVILLEHVNWFFLCH